jgi:hypothetical protein
MRACFGIPVTGGGLVLVDGLALGLALRDGLALVEGLFDGDAGPVVGGVPGPSRAMSSALYAPVPYQPWRYTWIEVCPAAVVNGTLSLV